MSGTEESCLAADEWLGFCTRYGELVIFVSFSKLEC